MSICNLSKTTMLGVFLSGVFMFTVFQEIVSVSNKYSQTLDEKNTQMPYSLESFYFIFD